MGAVAQFGCEDAVGRRGTADCGHYTGAHLGPTPAGAYYDLASGIAYNARDTLKGVPGENRMLKKARAGIESGKADEGSGLSQSVLKSSHQIWLAGLGAFAKAQTEGVKVFDALVKQGASLEAKTRHAAAATADAAREAAASKAKEVHAMAGGTWDRLEQVFQERVARALGQLGVYTSSDVERLTQRVNDLSEAVNALLKAQGIKRPPSATAKHAPVKGARKSARSTASRTVASATGAVAKTLPKAAGTTKKPAKPAVKAAKTPAK